MLTEAILLEQNKRLRDEIDELRETMRQMRTSSSAPDRTDLPSYVPYLTRHEETVFRRLLAGTGFVSKNALYDAMYPEGESREPQIVIVMLSRLRAKLKGAPVQIETLRGRGWRLGPQTTVKKELKEQAHTGVLSGSGTKAA